MVFRVSGARVGQCECGRAHVVMADSTLFDRYLLRTTAGHAPDYDMFVATQKVADCSRCGASIALPELEDLAREFGPAQHLSDLQHPEETHHPFASGDETTLAYDSG